MIIVVIISNSGARWSSRSRINNSSDISSSSSGVPIILQEVFLGSPSCTNSTILRTNRISGQRPRRPVSTDHFPLRFSCSRPETEIASPRSRRREGGEEGTFFSRGVVDTPFISLRWRFVLPCRVFTFIKA